MNSYKSALVENVLGVVGKNKERHQYQQHVESRKITNAKKQRMARLAKLFHMTNT